MPPHPDVLAAHTHSSRHRAALEASTLAGCFDCLAVFEPREIQRWIPERADGGDTALCPRCGIDSVLPASAGFPLTREFLGAMQAHWFSTKP